LVGDGHALAVSSSRTPRAESSELHQVEFRYFVSTTASSSRRLCGERTTRCSERSQARRTDWSGFARACPNVILNDNQLSGFVDVGRAAVSDRWRDLALCLRSIRCNWGEQWREVFLRTYGCKLDQQKLSFFTLLDEFF
jgi:hypothetical protein